MKIQSDERASIFRYEIPNTETVWVDKSLILWQCKYDKYISSVKLLFHLNKRKERKRLFSKILEIHHKQQFINNYMIISMPYSTNPQMGFCRVYVTHIQYIVTCREYVTIYW